MMPESTARAESSCKRCHRRKKRCDKTLPQCRACKHAKIACSFLDDETQVASYPVAYVRGLERRVKELEQQLVSSLTPQNSQNDPSLHAWDQSPDLPVGDDPLFFENPTEATNKPPHAQPVENMIRSLDTLPISPFVDAPAQRSENIAEELRLLSLEAAAERYLGSSSGVSFAKLTESVLRRLSPDQDGFVFDEANNEENPYPVWNMDTLSNINPVFFEMNHPLASLQNFTSILDNTSTEEYGDVIDLALLDPGHISYILGFYFAHSHTLYPIIRKKDFEQVLWRVYADPSDPLGQSSLWQFRIWMILAIGSTTYCSVSLMDEDEPVRFFNKAMTYFEAAMGCGDLVNTWFLVGVAARMATGMGLHTSEIYQALPVDVAEQQKRIFFSLYMMDRVVSLALGRPFAIQDDDITVEPFADADDENIKPDAIAPSHSLEPSPMAVPLHILALRKIASDIGTRVHSTRLGSQQNPEVRDQTIQDLHKRLVEWRRDMPFPLPDLQSKVPHLCTSWFDLNYYTHIIMLYRPSPLNPNLDASGMKTLAEASGMAIRQAINLHRQHRFAYNWLNLVAVFNSALSLMYTSTAQADNLFLVVDHSRAITDLELAVELLDSFGRKFSSAKKIQNMIKPVIARLKVHTISSVGF
ncbi:hypothetical protein N7532_007647 [Penicillium argentinense]|uniref:Zn(2)-C6 fungal-type domain-containing protein n=1 Tax=Penicillium argentinense TaxID=1131581 RepID=A0A9W9K0W2_9EURO|nr:uncharacterized protein N7532_007647 [Penicillium argentinense]KAJ5088963.1 hypothetical protein N7532_007647 [Penicillium argentinense]